MVGFADIACGLIWVGITKQGGNGCAKTKTLTIGSSRLLEIVASESEIITAYKDRGCSVILREGELSQIQSTWAKAVSLKHSTPKGSSFQDKYQSFRRLWPLLLTAFDPNRKLRPNAMNISYSLFIATERSTRQSEPAVIDTRPRAPPLTMP